MILIMSNFKINLAKKYVSMSYQDLLLWGINKKKCSLFVERHQVDTKRKGGCFMNLVLVYLWIYSDVQESKSTVKCLYMLVGMTYCWVSLLVGQSRLKIESV